MLNNIIHLDKPIKGYELENVENQRQEYKLIGSFLRNRSLRLWSYNHLTGSITLVQEIRDDEVTMICKNGKLTYQFVIHTEAKVNSNDTHFEALNLKSAQKRVEKFISGKIKDLCNLRTYNPEGLTLDKLI